MSKSLLPKTPNKPGWVAASDKSIRIPFPGAGMVPWQAAAAAAMLSAMVGVAPWMGGLAGVFLPGFLAVVRDKTAPKLEFYADKLEITTKGRTVPIGREAVSSARIVREDQRWSLVIETAMGPVALEETGASPAELQWAADLVHAWRDREASAPAPQSSVVEEGVGATTFVVGAPVARSDIAVGVFIGMLACALLVWLGAILDLTGLINGLLLAPLAAVVGHLVGSRRARRTEISVREQAILVRERGDRLQQKTISLADVEGVEIRTDQVLLYTKAEVVTLPAKGCAPVLGEAIEAHRKSLLARPAQEGESEAEQRQALARLAGISERIRS